MLARIYKPSPSAMQSGKARKKRWVLEYEQQSPRRIDPLMGWTSADDMGQQVSLEFGSMGEAMAYAENNHIAYQLFEPHNPSPKAKSYSDNFSFDRKIPWTH